MYIFCLYNGRCRKFLYKSYGLHNSEITAENIMRLDLDDSARLMGIDNRLRRMGIVDNRLHNNQQCHVSKTDLK